MINYEIRFSMFVLGGFESSTVLPIDGVDTWRPTTVLPYNGVSPHLLEDGHKRVKNYDTDCHCDNRYSRKK